LLEEEKNLTESESKMKSMLSGLKKNVEDSQRELESVRAHFDREKRSLADIRVKKSLEEQEVNRLAELIKFNQQSVREEGKNRAEAEGMLGRLKEELSRTQRDVVAASRRVAEEEKMLEQMKLREMEMRVVISSLTNESDGISALITEEKMKLDSLRVQNRDIVLTIKTLKEEIKGLVDDKQQLHGHIMSLKSQLDATETTRENITKELNKLRDMEILEMKRSERLDKIYSECEVRLSELRNELARTEEDLEKNKVMNAEEEKRISDSRRLLRASLEELSNVENSIAASNRKLYEERQRAIQEIGL
jgi:myosin protein heavy chain